MFGSNEAVLKKDVVSYIQVHPKTLCLYRCVAVCGNVELQQTHRSSTGASSDWNIEAFEHTLASRIRAEVISLFSSTNAQSKPLDVALNYSLTCLPSGKCQSMAERIDAICSNTDRIDPLEVLAIAYLTKTQVHLYQNWNSDYKLYAKYPSHAYSSRQPILLVLSGATDGNSFAVLIDKNSSRRWRDENKGSVFEDFAKTAADEDMKITFEQLIDPSRMLSSPGNKQVFLIPDIQISLLSGIQKFLLQLFSSYTAAAVVSRERNMLTYSFLFVFFFLLVTPSLVIVQLFVLDGFHPPR